MTAHGPQVAIVDLGMGNLHSVSLACGHVGLSSVRTTSPGDVASADAVILPGVGAFGAAMDALRHHGLVTALTSFVDSGRPLFGICLGMQLLLEESEEFGLHQGLGLVHGSVRRLPYDSANPQLKVPQVGWNAIFRRDETRRADRWTDTPLASLADGEAMYFVHSYFAVPREGEVVLSTTTYGGLTYCSSLLRGNVFGCQFHPERSGARGLDIYRNWALALGVTAGPTR
jgi:glutamine amidotransferase